MERTILSLIITLISGWLGVTLALALCGQSTGPLFPLVVLLLVGSVSLFYYYRKRKSR